MIELKLRAHFEYYFGPTGNQKNLNGYAIAAYEQIVLGGRAYTTLGLGNASLPSPVSDKTIRQEILMLLPTSLREKYAIQLLQRVTDRILEHHRPLVRGEVVGGGHGPILPRTRMEALYVAPPVYLPPEFASCTLPNGKTVAIAWLIPIASSEAAMIDERGWSAFEQALIDREPDLVDMNRPLVA